MIENIKNISDVAILAHVQSNIVSKPLLLNTTEVLELIIDLVCTYFDVSKEEVLTKTRKRDIAFARFHIFYFGRNYKLKCEFIGEYFNCHHTSVLYGVDFIKTVDSTHIEKLTKLIKSKINEENYKAGTFY